MAPRLAAWLLPFLLLAGCHEPPEPDNLGEWVFFDVEAGEEEWKEFTVGKGYDRMSLNYNLTNVSHVSLWFVDPDGARSNATLDESGLPELNVTAPARGTWEFHLRLENETGRAGHIETAVFWVLGHRE